ncbi:hypothetical protein AAEX28_03150 [Lentisphaerota bacterium WC36G]|nr:hypothetical protein LJT99_06025 [Lentisphaerae bacterium WC36]
MSTVCPYCDVEVSEHQIEAEDGCCPECGAFITIEGEQALFDDVDSFNEDFDFDDEESEDEDFDDDDY